MLGKTSAGGKKIDNSFDFADALLTENGVAVVPGAAFGAEGYVRLSYASDIPSIEKGIDKLPAYFPYDILRHLVYRVWLKSLQSF